jgi:hypothetical protein
MKYTTYFSRNLKANGVPHLSPDMFATYMNIVHLEGRIAQLNDLINKAESNDQKFVYRLQKDLILDKIKRLTGDHDPKQVLKELVHNH